MPWRTPYSSTSSYFGAHTYQLGGRRRSKGTSCRPYSGSMCDPHLSSSCTLVWSSSQTWFSCCNVHRKSAVLQPVALAQRLRSLCEWMSVKLHDVWRFDLSISQRLAPGTWFSGSSQSACQGAVDHRDGRRQESRERQLCTRGVEGLGGVRGGVPTFSLAFLGTPLAGELWFIAPHCLTGGGELI